MVVAARSALLQTRWALLPVAVGVVGGGIIMSPGNINAFWGGVGWGLTHHL